MNFSNVWKPAEPAPLNCSKGWNRLRRCTFFFSKPWKTLLLIVALCGSAVAQLEDMEISGFRVPEYDEQGQMTYQLFGDHAVLGSDGMVKVEGVRVEFYREEHVFMTVTSPYCFYNQKTRKVHSDAPIRAEMDDVELTGTGYLLNADERTVQVLEESRVVFQELLKESKSGKTTSTNETVITAKEMFLNYTARRVRFSDSVHIQNKETNLDCVQMDLFFYEDNKIERALAEGSVVISNEEIVMKSGQLDLFFTADNEIERALAESGVEISNAEWRVSGARGTLKYLERTARLEGGVHAESKETDMTCDTLNLRFDESRQIDWIEALGQVKILSEGRKAVAGKAVFDVKTDEFLLEENPKVIEGRNMLLADTIRFWRGDGRLVCEPAARVVFYPDENFKSGIFEK